MPDEAVNPADERAFADFLDRLVAGQPGDAGVDPILAETARDLQDRASHSTASAPPAGALASIRADLFGVPATPRHRPAALGIVPGAAFVTRPATQIALAAAILLAILTGFAAFRDHNWLGHMPAGTHGALAASATSPMAAQLAMSPDSGATTAFVSPATLSPEVQSLIRNCPMPATEQIPGIDMTNLAWAVGRTPLWMTGSLAGSGSGQHERRPYVSIRAATTLLYWYTAPDLQSPVTVRLSRIGDNAPSPMNGKGQMRFDPNGVRRQNGQAVAMPGMAQPWAQYTTLPGTGCYELSAQWAGGAWTIRFPVVIEHPSATRAAASPAACATPSEMASPRTFTEPPPPYSTAQPGPPQITPGIQQVVTRPGLPLITPTPFATIVLPIATPATPSAQCR